MCGLLTANNCLLSGDALSHQGHVTAHVFKKINKKLYCGDSAQNTLTNKAKNQTKSAISLWDAWLGIYCSLNIEKHIEVMSSDRLFKMYLFFCRVQFLY